MGKQGQADNNLLPTISISTSHCIIAKAEKNSQYPLSTGESNLSNSIKIIMLPSALASLSHTQACENYAKHSWRGRYIGPGG